MKKIAIYSRKSRATDRGNSIENQIELCKEYAKNNILEPVEYKVYIDDGFSGGNIDRPQFQKMLKAAKNKEFDILIAYKLDRISRSVADYSKTYEFLTKQGIEFIIVKERFDTTTPYGRLSMNISAVMAQFEREIISERIKDNVYLNAQSGNYTGGAAPIGYKTKRIEYTNNRGQIKKKTILEADFETQEIVKDIYNKYIEYKSISKVLKYLNSREIKTRNNAKFDTSSLSSILSNLTYAIADNTLYRYLCNIGTEIYSSEEAFDGSKALYVHNTKNKITKSRTDIKDQMVVMGEHAGIIPAKDWIEVQKIMESNACKFFTNKGRLATSDVGLLSGLLKCSLCGSTMRIRKHGINSNNEPLYYYSCMKKDTTSSCGCNVKNLTGHKTDKLLIDKLLDLYENTDLLKIKTAAELSVKNNTSPIQKLKKEIYRYENKINNLVEQLSENTSSAKYILAEIEKLDTKINKLKTQIKEKEEMTKNEEYIQYNLELISKALYDLKNLNDIDNIDTKRNILKAIIKEIKWDGITIQVYFNNAEAINFCPASKQ